MSTSEKATSLLRPPFSKLLFFTCQEDGYRFCNLDVWLSIVTLDVSVLNMFLANSQHFSSAGTFEPRKSLLERNYLDQQKFGTEATPDTWGDPLIGILVFCTRRTLNFRFDWLFFVRAIVLFSSLIFIP